MRLRSLTVRGFRCFGAEGITVDLEPLTCLIGPNGSGKTALLFAVRRMFGIEAADRRVRPSDFFLRDDERLNDEPSRSLRLEARLEVQEREEAEGEESGDDDASAAAFDHMIVEEPGGTPYVRVELAATWTDDGTLDGDIEQQLSWITTVSDDESEIEKNRRKMAASDRGLIRAIYVSAVRDPTAEVRAVASTGLGRLLRSAKWSEVLRDLVTEQSASMAERLAGERALASLNSALNVRWPALYRGSRLAEAGLRPPGSELKDVIGGLRPTFTSNENGDQLDVDALSDGFRSLFSIAFTAALLDVEEKIRAAGAGATGFDDEQIRLPILTILMVEEPENHVSPHHLGRIVRQLRDISEFDTGQVVLTSHAPAVVRRVQPEEVRYCLGDETTNVSSVKSLSLPTDSDDATKYVREAIQSYPELFFSRLVVLGEGATEEIVLPRLLRLAGHELDLEQISVVPLGGRHVHHFWRLLSDLGVPYLTLLDLDRGRPGGGWNRVKYAIEQLIAVGEDRDELLAVEDEHGRTTTLTASEFERLGDRDDADEELDAWVESLESYGVFYSAPLDIDLLMLQAFPEIYMAASRSKPRVPKRELDKQRYLVAASEAVLGEQGDRELYSDELDLLPWYRSLFIHGSKPAAHMSALASLGDGQLRRSCPRSLKRFVKACKAALNPAADASEGA